MSLGIGLAFVAMLCWGFGDFLIQRATRKIGDFEILAVILGLLVNREKLQFHQKFGLTVAVVSAIVLAGITV